MKTDADPKARAEHPRLTLFLMTVLVGLIGLAVGWTFRNGHGPTYLGACYGAGLAFLWFESRDDKAMRPRTLLMAAAAPLTMPILAAVGILEIGRGGLSRLGKRSGKGA